MMSCRKGGLPTKLTPGSSGGKAGHEELLPEDNSSPMGKVASVDMAMRYPLGGTAP